MLNIFIRFLRRQDGNFAVMTALLMPVLLFGALLAFDYASITIWQRKLQDASDVVALRTAQNIANEMPFDAAKIDAINELSALLGLPKENLQSSEIEISQSFLRKDDPFSVVVNGKLDGTNSSIRNVFLDKTDAINSNSTAAATIYRSGKPAVTSLYFILDSSSTMATGRTKEYDPAYFKGKCPRARDWSVSSGANMFPPNCHLLQIDVMKRALKQLLSKIAASPVGSIDVRTGAVSYSDGIDLAGDPLTNFQSGTDATLNFIENRVENFGANTDGAVLAYAVDKFDKEPVATREIKGIVREKNIVYISDGQNVDGYDRSGNYRSKYDVDKEILAGCALAKSMGIKVTSIYMDFEEPAKAENVLAEYRRGIQVMKDCAYSAADFYQVKDAEKFIEALSKVGQVAVDRKIRLSR